MADVSLPITDRRRQGRLALREELLVRRSRAVEETSGVTAENLVGEEVSTTKTAPSWTPSPTLRLVGPWWGSASWQSRRSCPVPDPQRGRRELGASECATGMARWASGNVDVESRPWWCRASSCGVRLTRACGPSFLSTSGTGCPDCRRGYTLACPLPGSHSSSRSIRQWM